MSSQQSHFGKQIFENGSAGITRSQDPVLITGARGNRTGKSSGASERSVSPPSEKSSRLAATLGVPIAKRLVSLSDCLHVLVCLASFIVAFGSVNDVSLAAKLGQINQLKVVGLTLSIMAYCTSTQVQLFLLYLEAASKNSALQNFDGILRLSPTARQLSAVYRIALTLLFMLPLGLSISYKSFVGGSTTLPGSSITGPFGATGPPGTQNVGYGLSLFVNATLPWFEDPKLNGNYGFNMHVASENVTAMLDGPLPELVADIQSSMHLEDSIRITAEVNAVVCKHSDVLNETRTWLNDVFDQDIKRNVYDVAFREYVNNASFYIGLMNPKAYDFSTIWMSKWSLLNNETFGSQVQQYNLTRQKYMGTWTITPAAVALTKATPIPDSLLRNQSVLTHNWLAALQLYMAPMTEFDWRYREPWTFKVTSEAKYIEFIKTDATLVGGMIWSRMVSQNGPETWGPGSPDLPDLKYSISADTYREVMTLRREWPLSLLLIINPVLLTAALCLRTTWLRHVPIGQGFNVISMLSAAQPESLHVLYGASLSGRLSKVVPLRFSVLHASNSPGKVLIDFEQTGHHGHVQTGRTYH
jgi:hypothetical protein